MSDFTEWYSQLSEFEQAQITAEINRTLNGMVGDIVASAEMNEKIGARLEAKLGPPTVNTEEK